MRRRLLFPATRLPAMKLPSASPSMYTTKMVLTAYTVTPKTRINMRNQTISYARPLIPLRRKRGARAREPGFVRFVAEVIRSCRRKSKVEGQESRISSRVSTPDPKTFGLRPFDLRPFDLRPSTFDLRPSTFDLRPSTFDLRPSTVPI